MLAFFEEESVEVGEVARQGGQEVGAITRQAERLSSFVKLVPIRNECHIANQSHNAAQAHLLNLHAPTRPSGLLLQPHSFRA